MTRYNAPFEIHVHGDVRLRADVGFDALQDALKPLWKYAGARSLADGAASAFEDEPARPRLLYRARYLDRVALPQAAPWR